MEYNSAVLVGLYRDSIILTKRANSLTTFSGQICFPGGKFEKLEDNDYTDTAIREFSEEVNFVGTIKPIFCLLPEEIPIGNHKIYIVIAKLDGCIVGFNANEVSKLLFLKNTDLIPELFKLNPDFVNIKHCWCFSYNKEFVWGVTAYILNILCQYKNELSYEF